MGKPYSTDLRQRLVDYVLAGHSARAAGRIFGVSASTAVRFVARHREQGSVEPKAQGRRPGTVGKLAPHLDFLEEVVVSERDITLQELAGALEEARGVRVHLSSIHRALSRIGYSFKKNRWWRKSATAGTSARPGASGSTTASRACAPSPIG